MKKQEMKNIIEKNVLDYARYTITDRAIPSLFDGLKNIHRRIIWSMYIDKLTHDKHRTKSVNAVGSVLRFSPHGDSSVYDACVRLTNDSVLYNLIDGKGAFSSITSRDVYAGASRYTEMRLASISQELLKDINKNTVDMVNNYDDTRLEPTSLPVTFPLILANPNKGIAVGIASNICSFNLNDIVENTIRIIKGQDTFAMFPDFPTYANVIKDESVAENVRKYGKGSFRIRAKYHVESNSIIITEIPYTTTREAIIDSVISLVKDNKISGITNINDNTGVNGLEIAIDLKKNVDVETLMEKLFKSTPLESTFNCNFTVLLHNKPVTLGTDDIIREWIKYRANIIKRSTEFDLNKKKESLHLLEGLQKVLLDIDKAIKIIRETKKDKDVVANLMSEFGLDSIQAENVANIKLRNINEEYILDKISSIKKLESEIEDLESIISSKKRIAKIIIDELNHVKNTYAKDRKSKLIEISDIPRVTAESVEVDNYNVKVFVSEGGYLKKIPLTSLRGNFDIKVKDGDRIVREIETTNNSDILVFTNKQNVYKYKTYELEDSKPSLLGEYLPSLLNLKDEEIQFVTVTNDYKGFMIVGYSSGKLAKISLKEGYETKQNRSVLKNAYSNKSEPVYFNHINEDLDLFFISNIDKVVLFNTSLVEAKATRMAQGNQIMKMKNESKVIGTFGYNSIQATNIEYYRINTSNSVGKYLKKGDFFIED